MRGAGDWRKAMLNGTLNGTEVVVPKWAKAETAGSARNVDGLAAWSLKASPNVGRPGGVQALSLRPSESLGALRQVDWALAFVLDCLDGRALASVEMTSVALECSARAAASRRAQGNIYAMLLAVELGLDPDALGARYLAATTEELIQALIAALQRKFELLAGLHRAAAAGAQLPAAGSDACASLVAALVTLDMNAVRRQVLMPRSRVLSPADMRAALDAEFDEVLGSSDSDA